MVALKTVNAPTISASAIVAPDVVAAKVTANQRANAVAQIMDQHRARV